MDITLSTEQKALFEVMEETKQHLFVTGRAGTGKSELLRHFREHTRKRVVVAAPTGIAALNVRGQTIHSLFRIAPQLHRKGDLAPNARVCTLLKRIDTLVIDEISMVRADLLDAVDERLREACKNDIPFGGVQIVMFGDVYQLPPVVEQGLLPYFEAVHGGYFFFNAQVWKEAEFKIYELTQVFRQKDPVFKDILNAVRDGTVVESQVEQLNGRHGVSIPDEGTVTLAPTNALVTAINQQRLDLLPGKTRQYPATITGEMKKSTFPTEENLQLKEGAQIVLLKNDKNGRWVNGTVGKIEKLFDTHIDVRVGGIVYSLERETWEEIAYTYDHETQKVEAKVASSFTQYPIRLAWALTIHKSQGQTYESVALDLTTATFAPGQLYVALSRCTSLEGLYLKMPVKQAHIIVEPKVRAFMLRREAIEIAVVEEAQTVMTEALHHDAIVSINEVQEQTKVVAVLSDILPVETLHHDAIEAMNSRVIEEAAFKIKQDLSEQFQAERSDQALEIFGETVLSSASEETVSPLDGDTVIEGSVVVEPVVEEPLIEGRVSRIAAIEVLCPACGNQCVDRALESPMITYDLVGHIVICSVCRKACIVPLNAFSLQGNVVAREKPAGGVTNSKKEKKGRTQKERKAKSGRKTKGTGVRQPMQLSLDLRIINTLNAMGVNKSELFEELLKQYEPFLDAWAELGNEDFTEDGDELDHDGM